jgi:peptidyl-prolyl cis-trans isomerase A (cyclophilin A)
MALCPFMLHRACPALLVVAAACGGDDAAAPDAAGPDDLRPPIAADLAEYTSDLPGDGPLVATIETSEGTLRCELFAAGAPITVANFVGLATGKKTWRHPRTGDIQRGVPYYDGLTIHRVVPGFVIQGGDPLGNGTGGPGYEFAIEVSAELRHTAGALSMANAGPEHNGSQFFVTVAAQPRLDGGYSVFGQCAELEVVTAIADLGSGDGPPSRTVQTTRVTIARAPAP